MCHVGVSSIYWYIKQIVPKRLLVHSKWICQWSSRNTGPDCRVAACCESGSWDQARLLGSTPPHPSFEFSLVSLLFTIPVQTPTEPIPAEPDSGRANQPWASALAPFPVSACRLPALSEGQLSAVRPTLPLHTTIKSPLFWEGGEKWEETDAPYTKTRSHRSDSKRHTEMLALPAQISASMRDTWVSWHRHSLYSLSDSKS